MILTRKGLITFTRKRLDEWKRLEVPRMMRDGNIETLMKIVEMEDYLPFKRRTQPEFTVEELGLRGEDDGRVCTLYVWGNPFVFGGDIDFFKDIREFPEFLKESCGEWGDTYHNILTRTIQPYIILSKYPWNGCKSMSIEEVLAPELIEERI